METSKRSEDDRVNSSEQSQSDDEVNFCDDQHGISSESDSDQIDVSHLMSTKGTKNSSIYHCAMKSSCIQVMNGTRNAKLCSHKKQDCVWCNFKYCKDGKNVGCNLCANVYHIECTIMMVQTSKEIKAEFDAFHSIIKSVTQKCHKYGAKNCVIGYKDFKKKLIEINEATNSQIYMLITDECISKNPQRFMELYGNLLNARNAIFRDSCFSDIGKFLVKRAAFQKDDISPEIIKKLDHDQKFINKLKPMLNSFKAKFERNDLQINELKEIKVKYENLEKAHNTLKMKISEKDKLLEQIQNQVKVSTKECIRDKCLKRLEDERIKYSELVKKYDKTIADFTIMQKQRDDIYHQLAIEKNRVFMYSGEPDDDDSKIVPANIFKKQNNTEYRDGKVGDNLDIHFFQNGNTPIFPILLEGFRILGSVQEISVQMKFMIKIDEDTVYECNTDEWLCSGRNRNTSTILCSIHPPIKIEKESLVNIKLWLAENLFEHQRVHLFSELFSKIKENLESNNSCIQVELSSSDKNNYIKMTELIYTSSISN